jgi:hypothetical protein
VPKAGHGESKTVFVPALWYKIEGIVDADREFPPPAEVWKILPAVSLQETLSARRQ